MIYDNAARASGRSGLTLPWNPFKALVAPRPIAWISTMSKGGHVNLAPYSYFQAVADNPDIVMFSANPTPDSGGLRDDETPRLPKDSEGIASHVGEFVVNLVDSALIAEMNDSSAHFPSGVSEPLELGIELAPSSVIETPRVAAAPAAMECVVVDTHDVRHRDGKHIFRIVFGQVVSSYIADRYVVDGRVDTASMKLVTRMGYDEYSIVERSFRLRRPDRDLMKEGNAV